MLSGCPVRPLDAVRELVVARTGEADRHTALTNANGDRRFKFKTIAIGRMSPPSHLLRRHGHRASQVTLLLAVPEAARAEEAV